MLRQLSVEEVCQKLKPIFGRKIDDIYLRYAMADSREEKEDISHMLSALYNKHLSELLDNKILLEPPKESDVEGNYKIGNVSYAGRKLYPFNLRDKDWPRHVCISGMSGSGKTTLAFNILESFIKNDKPFLVFDWKKSFRPLVLLSPQVNVFTIGNEGVSNLFRTNINKPPKGIDPREWINVLCDLLVESFSASYGVHKVLLETLDSAFEQFGVYEGSNNYPTWNHIAWYLKEKMEKAKGRESGWVESALRIASVLTFGNFGKVISSKEEGTLSVEDFFNKKVILELNALSNIEKKFFCEFILTYIYKYKKANQKNVEGNFDYAILVDEAHNVFLKSQTNFSKESVTDMIYREMREYGTSLICLDQHVSKLSDTVKGNSACTIAFQQQLPQDIYDISGIMQLKDNKQFFSMLSVGSAIVKLSERYAKPFLVEVEPVKLRENDVRDKEIKDRAKSFVSQIEVENCVDEDFNKKLIPEKEVRITSVKHDSVEVENPEKPLEQVNEFDFDPKFYSPQTKPTYFTFEKSDSLKNEDENVKEVFDSNGLTKQQQVLYEYVEKRLAKGESLKEIENILEAYKDEGNYAVSDVYCAVNYALEKCFSDVSKVAQNDLVSKPVEVMVEKEIREPKSRVLSENKTKTRDVVTGERQNIYKAPEVSKTKKLDKTSEAFLNFIRQNNTSELGTVQIYKRLGLSSRKGNKIKQELMNAGLIKVVEEKNEKGWKKIIQIA